MKPGGHLVYQNKLFSLFTAKKMLSSRPSVAAIGSLDELPDFHDIELGVLDKQGVMPKRRKFSLFGK